MPSQCVFKMESHLLFQHLHTFTIYHYLGTESVVHIFVFKSQTHTQLPTVEENTCNIYRQRDSFRSRMTKTRLKPTSCSGFIIFHHATNAKVQTKGTAVR